MTESEEVSPGTDSPAPRPLSQKVLAALSIGLAPLVVVALALSASSYSDAQDQSKDEIRGAADRLVREVNDIIADETLILRGFALRRFDLPEMTNCAAELDRAVQLDTIFDSAAQATPSGVTFCRSGTGDPISAEDVRRAVEAVQSAPDQTQEILFDSSRQRILFAVTRDESRSPVIVAAAPLAEFQQRLAALPRPVGSAVAVEVADTDDDPVSEFTPLDSAPGRYGVRARTRVGGLIVRYDEPVSSFSPRRVATILAPPLMWLATLLIAWGTIRKLVVRPLREMQARIDARRETGEVAELRPTVGNTSEFLQFASSYDALAAKQRADRQEREAALEEQQRLVREVHHRVKNNLQIVTSLLSIKARDTDDVVEERAYGIIQMRVEALALVHRWLYADAEQRGVDLGALLHDLFAGLEGSLKSVMERDARFHAKLDHIFVGQDAAVPIAFLVTEILSDESMRASGDLLDVSAELTEEPDQRGRLVIASSQFSGRLVKDSKSAGAAGRIVLGMARQLRASLEFDEIRHAFVLEFGTES